MICTVPFETTLHVRDHCLCLHVQRAARSIARRFDEALRPHGLTNGQLSLLLSLNRPVPPNMRSVAELLAMDRTTLTAALKALQQRKLVNVRVDPTDRRGRLLRLTAKGVSTLAAALPTWERTQRELEGLLTHTSARRLCRDLRAIS